MLLYLKAMFMLGSMLACQNKERSIILLEGHLHLSLQVMCYSSGYFIFWSSGSFLTFLRNPPLLHSRIFSKYGSLDIVGNCIPIVSSLSNCSVSEMYDINLHTISYYTGQCFSDS